MLNFKPSAIPSSALDGCAVHLLPFFTALRVLLLCLSLYFVLSSVVKRVLPSLLFFFFLHSSLGIDILKLSTVLFSHCTFSYYPLHSPSLCLRLGCFACEGASKWT
jgi:hypothetical protein